MVLNVKLVQDDDGVWTARCLSIPGCVCQGKTRKQALKNIGEAIERCLGGKTPKNNKGVADLDDWFPPYDAGPWRKKFSVRREEIYD